MSIRTFLLCAIAGLSCGTTKAGESETKGTQATINLGEKEVIVSHPLEFLPESSKIRSKCLRLPRSWGFKSKADKGCNHIAELFKKQMLPEKPITGWDRMKDDIRNKIAFLDSSTPGSEALKQAIRDILPEETDKTKYAEYGQVIATCSRIPEVLKNNDRIKKQREEQEKIEVAKNPKF